MQATKTNSILLIDRTTIINKRDKKERIKTYCISDNRSEAALQAVKLLD